MEAHRRLFLWRVGEDNGRRGRTKQCGCICTCRTRCRGSCSPPRTRSPSHGAIVVRSRQKVAGITYRQLDYWARKQIVEPSITPSHGSGSRRLYSFKDVVILAVSKRLLDAGINLQNVTTAIGFLAQRTPNSWPASPSCAMGRMCMSARTANRWWLCSKAAELCSGCPSDRYGIRSKRL